MQGIDTGTLFPINPETPQDAKERVEGTNTHPTLADATGAKLRAFHARFDCLPPRGTRQSGTRLAVVGGKPRTFKTSKAKREESNLLALLLSAKPKDWTPIGEPVAVSIKMVWPYRRSEKRSIVRAGNEIPLASRSVGDIDNQALKAPLDACVAAQLLLDDSLVAAVQVVRCWGPVAYWMLTIWRLSATEPVPLRELLDGGGGGEKTAPGKAKSDAAVRPEGNRTQIRPGTQTVFGWEGGAE